MTMQAPASEGAEARPSFDLTQHSAYMNGTPLDVFAWMRRSQPIFFHPRADGSEGFWCITKYADIAAVGRDPKKFSSTRKVPLHPSAADDAMSNVILTSMDPPRHTRVRNAVQYAFMPRQLIAAKPIVRHFVDRAINSMIEMGEADLYSIAASLPISMIARLMDLPDEMHPQILAWTNRTFGRNDPDFAASPADTATALKEILAYGNEIAAQRRKQPGTDLVSALVNAKIDDQPLSDQEIAWNFFLLMGAGNDTTRTLILNMANLLLGDPTNFAELRSNRAVISNAVEESLRLEPSVRGMGRMALEIVELRGQTILPGDHVFMWYCSGNRDEEVFERPDTFDIRRANANRHQSFGGGGPHFCAGAELARLQAKSFFDQVVERLPDIARNGPAVRAASNGFMNSIKSLPVRFTPGRTVVPSEVPSAAH